MSEWNLLSWRHQARLGIVQFESCVSVSFVGVEFRTTFLRIQEFVSSSPIRARVEIYIDYKDARKLFKQILVYFKSLSLETGIKVYTGTGKTKNRKDSLQFLLSDGCIERVFEFGFESFQFFAEITLLLFRFGSETLLLIHILLELSVSVLDITEALGQLVLCRLFLIKSVEKKMLRNVKKCEKTLTHSYVFNNFAILEEVETPIITSLIVAIKSPWFYHP